MVVFWRTKNQDGINYQSLGEILTFSFYLVFFVATLQPSFLREWECEGRPSDEPLSHCQRLPNKAADGYGSRERTMGPWDTHPGLITLEWASLSEGVL